MNVDYISDGAPGLLGRLCGMAQRFHLLPSHSIMKSVHFGTDSSVGQFQDLFLRLETDKSDLDQVMRDIEARFLAMGACVRDLATLSRNLQTQSERLASSSGTEFKTHLQGALEVIRQQLDFVGQCHEDNAQLIGRLARYMDQFQKLRNCEDDLGKILTPMQTVSVLFKIHCVSLGNEEKTFFETLTEQIVALQLQARTTFGDQMHGLLKTGQQLSASIPHLKEESLLQRERVTQQKASIEKSMEALQRQFEKIHASHEQLSQFGKNIKSASVGGVMGLQYQDITRQKWEHVAEAIQEMREKIEPATGQSRPDSEQLGFVRDVSQIQVRQLQAIQTDLEQSQTAVSKSVKAMLEHLRGMDTECQTMCGQAEGSSAIEGMVKVLLDALAEARVWVTELASTAKTTANAVSSFDKTASDVSGTLRRLSASIAMIAINAQVQVARLEDENGLDVLAESICVAADDIKKFSETVGAELDELVQELHETVLECHKLEEKTATQQNWLQGQGHQQDEQLHACRNGTLSVQQEVNESLKKIHEQAEAALTHADFKDVSQEGFKRLQSTLQECASLADVSLGSATVVGIPGHVHSLKKSYTMESEREVFDAHVAERDATARAKAPAAEPIKSTESKKNLKEEKKKTEPEVMPKVETTEIKPEPQPVAAVAAENKSDLGDNVELF